jgi:hypothetical protein
VSPALQGEEREEEEEEADGTVGAGRVCQQRVCFSFSGAFKTYPTPWEGRPRRFHPIVNEWGGARVVPSQVRAVRPSPGRLHEPQTFLLLACLPLTSPPL